MADCVGTKLLATSPSTTPHNGTDRSNFRTEEIRGYLFKKTREGKWQKRWFETNGCFLTYYKKQGQKLLAALNLPQVGAITLLEADHVGTISTFGRFLYRDDAKRGALTECAAFFALSMAKDGPGLFTIELNERVYTIKARSHDEAAFWVDALLWRQAGGVIAQKSPDVSTHQVDNTLSSVPTTEEPDRTAASTSTRSSTHMDTTSNPHANVSDATTDQLGTTGAPCAACCSVQ